MSTTSPASDRISGSRSTWRNWAVRLSRRRNTAGCRPGTYVPNIKTPLYLIANEKDGNCPLPQAMQLYQRLRLLGKKTELVIYPGESHSMQHPTHLVDRLERLLRWFGAHLSADATPPAANPR